MGLMFNLPHLNQNYRNRPRTSTLREAFRWKMAPGHSQKGGDTANCVQERVCVCMCVLTLKEDLKILRGQVSSAALPVLGHSHSISF